MRTPQIRPWVLTDFGCRVLNLHILRTSVQGDLTPPRSNNKTNATAQTLSSERKHSRGSDDPLTALKKGAVLLRNGDYYYSRPKTQDFQEFCPGPPGSSQNPPFGSSSPHVLGKVVGSSIKGLIFLDLGPQAPTPIHSKGKLLREYSPFKGKP